MTDPHNISLVVSTYNWPQALELVLLGVAAQKKLPAEVLIADDGSGAATKELIRSFQHKFPVPLQHIWQPDEGFQLARIRNKAIAAAQADYIVQIDGDSIPEKHFIMDHARVAETGCFVRGTRGLLTPGASQRAIAQKKIAFHFYSSGVKHRNNVLRSPLLLPLGIKKETNSFRVKGSNMGFWRKDFIRVNGYNNAMEGWGHEDEELAARFINAGLRKKKVKLAAVQYHLHHKTASQEQEPLHCLVLENVRTQLIIACTNGMAQL
ncbi:glycosyltransferase family 2 protein [Niabella soli]|uniref:glycosyltransferase family 2 protein n=1 Tax=Niabella soli TaxID=446683 RepID=UPI0002499639|nr:glycosyltransferase family 2 protein [Niabella soli]